MRKKEKLKICNNAGMGLIEIVVGVAIITTMFFAVSTFYQKSLLVNRETAHLVQSGFLLEEGLEVVRFFRDADWQNVSTLVPGTDYYLIFTGASWATTTTPVSVDDTFYRTITIDDVYRDFSGTIVSTGGVLDDDIKKVNVSVSWLSDIATSTKTFSTYIANLF